MKPVKLEMINFGPYRHETIDFTKFEEASLFLISGRTGSGKSSIFDAMLYALYNVSSSDREIGELRSTFADLKDSRTQVIFHFEHQDKLYRVQRTLELKPKKGIDRGKGIGTKEASLVLLDSIDGRELLHLASQNLKTTKSVEELLQLTAEQFKQIILLPQYQFSQFLKSDVEAKREILRQIFGTQIFRDFEEALADRNKLLKQEQKALDDDLDKQFQNKSVWNQAEMESFAQAGEKERWQLAKAYLKKYRDEQHTLAFHVKEAEKQKNKAFENWSEGQQQAQYFDDLKAKEAKYESDILSKEDSHRKDQLLLERLEFADGLKGTYKSFTEAGRKAVQLEQAVSDLNKKAAKKAAEQASYQKKLDTLKQEREAQEKNYQSLPEVRQRLDAAQRLQNDQEQVQHSQKQLHALKEKREVLSRQENQNKQKLKAAEQEKERLKERLNALSEAKFKAGLIKHSLDSHVEKQNELLQEQHELEQKLSQAREDLSAAETELSQLQAASRNKKKDQLKLMIAKLQAELAEGEACPVCGSLEHPTHQTLEADEKGLKKLLEETEHLDSLIKTADRKVQALNSTLKDTGSRRTAVIEEQGQIAETVANAYRELQKAVSVSLDSLDFQESYSKETGQAILRAVEAEQKNCAEQRDAQEAAAAELEAAIQENLAEQQSAAQEQSVENDRLQQAEQDIVKLEESYADLRHAAYYQELEETIKTAYEAFMSSLEATETALHQTATAVSALEGSLAAEQNSLADNNQELAEQKRILKEALAQDRALTHDISQLADWLTELEHHRISTISDRISRFEEQKQALSQEIQALKERLEGKTYPDLDILKTQKEEADKNHLNLVEKQGGLGKQLQMMSETIKTIEDRQNQAEQNRQAVQDLEYLNKLVQGQGKNRIRLETYVIQAHLEQILDYANNHYIGLLSSQQFEFLISEKTSGNAQSGLNINIYDKTNNKELPASSLSGGETFIASLAIALSMSEVVQNTSNGALIETLFIDEGFGSLDEETLDKAVAVLETIGENRMVGVISHVKEMKETIEQQLLIEKRIDGSSSVTHRV